MKQRKAEKTLIHIETYGCQMNVADTERSYGVLRDAGYGIAETSDEADVVILNTCSVRERAEMKVHSRIGAIRHAPGARQPVIGVMGCVAQLEGEKLFARKGEIAFVAGTRATDRLPSLIEDALAGRENAIDLGERAATEKWDVAVETRHSASVAFVPIIEGCNKFCSYCIVPYSRGRERSRTASEIIREIENLRASGYKEVHLIGQNVNSYRPVTDEGLSEVKGATPFARLLRAVAATGIERVKFTTSFPRDFHADIVAALDEHENLCNWVHLPVQSGSDKVLRAMRRGYRKDDFLKRIENIKNARRRIAITSDIIVGYPTETADDFQETIELVNKCNFDGLYIFKYSERRGTPAAKLADAVSGKEKAWRFETLEKTQKANQKIIYESYLETEVEVLVSGRSARNRQTVTGHTTCHKIVNVEVAEAAVESGQIVKARITEAKPNSLYGFAPEYTGSRNRY